MQVTMGEDEVRDEVEVKKSINAWRQSERKIMIETVQDLIQTSHKYAKSQYTPNAQRVRWTKLAGQLIWYKDQILKNSSLEALTVQLEALKKRMGDSVRACPGIIRQLSFASQRRENRRRRRMRRPLRLPRLTTLKMPKKQ